MAPPVILAVRSYIPQEATSYPQESQSIIDRWEVVSDQQQALHPAFEQLGSKNGATSTPPTTTRLRKLDPIILSKVIVSVSTTQYGRVLCFAFSDGTIQFRDRFTMDEIYHEPNSDSIIHPSQVGFQWTDNTPCLQVAFSPTNCSFTQISEDSTIKWNRLHYPMMDLNGALQDADLKMIRVALTVALSSIVGQQGSFDDVLAIARPFAQTPDFASAWVKELVNMLKIAVDYSEAGHHDQLVKNIPLQQCLGVISHLSFRGDFKPRSHSGKFAMLALGIRSVFLVITVASNSPMLGVKEKLTPLDDPDVVDAVTGCIEWGFSLLAWLTNALFELVDDPDIAAMLGDQKRFSELAKYLESKNDASLQLLLCSSTRGFLSGLCRRLQHIEQVSTRAAQYSELRIQQQQQQDAAAGAGAVPTRAPHPALSEAYQRMERVVASALVKVPEFERLLAELSSDIQSAYHKTFSGIPLAKVKPQQGTMTDQQQQQLNEQFAKKAQAHCELDMVLGRNPPPCFREIVLKLFTVTLPAFRNQTDPAKLYFAKHKLLEVDDNPTILARKKAAGQYVDVFKRVEIVVNPRSKQTLNTWDEGLFPDDDLTTSAKLGSIINNHSSSNSNGVKPALGSGVSEEHGMGSYRTAITGTWTGIGDASRPQWRRCVRCASVVGDMFTSKPGYHFVLSQQRKCVCGASWGTVPRGT
ncbi:mediator complex, subunit Med16 [Chaetomium sp. MPI-SDFR-AT-0129]|nr:mediator complex, subunit Med16 [Chaetomium sp. MPI-SDFR-AT-0129]